MHSVVDHSLCQSCEAQYAEYLVKAAALQERHQFVKRTSKNAAMLSRKQQLHDQQQQQSEQDKLPIAVQQTAQGLFARSAVFCV